MKFIIQFSFHCHSIIFKIQAKEFQSEFFVICSRCQRLHRPGGGIEDRISGKSRFRGDWYMSPRCYRLFLVPSMVGTIDANYSNSLHLRISCRQFSTGNFVKINLKFLYHTKKPWISEKVWKIHQHLKTFY